MENYSKTPTRIGDTETCINMNVSDSFMKWYLKNKAERIRKARYEKSRKDIQLSLYSKYAKYIGKNKFVRAFQFFMIKQIACLKLRKEYGWKQVILRRL